GARDAQDQLQYVDIVLAHLQPQPLGEHSAERLDRRIDADLCLAEVSCERADQHDATAAALGHQGAEVLCQGELSGDVEVAVALHSYRFDADSLVPVSTRSIV